jgi:hypothetical protein
VVSGTSFDPSASITKICVRPTFRVIRSFVPSGDQAGSPAYEVVIWCSSLPSGLIVQMCPNSFEGRLLANAIRPLYPGKVAPAGPTTTAAARSAATRIRRLRPGISGSIHQVTICGQLRG